MKKRGICEQVSRGYEREGRGEEGHVFPFPCSINFMKIDVTEEAEAEAAAEAAAVSLREQVTLTQTIHQSI